MPKKCKATLVGCIIGEVVPKDYAEAARWYRKEAEQGYASAQFFLGTMYYKGEGVLKNYIESYAWALLAKANADVTSFRFRDFDDHISDLENRLTAEQIEKGQARAAELPRLQEQKSAE